MKYMVAFSCMIIMIACHPYKTLELKVKNPTEYTFNIDSSLVKTELVNSFSQKNYKGMNLITTTSDSIFYVFEDTITITNNDILLYNDSYELSSSMYYKKDRRLRYCASFLINIKGIDKTKTRVKINTIYPHILIGKNLFPKLPHMIRYEKTKKVKPSTIEEYELLQYIGKILSIDSMPPINYPINYSQLKPSKKPWE